MLPVYVVAHVIPWDFIDSREITLNQGRICTQV